MSKEHVEAANQAIETLLKARRKHVEGMTKAVTYSDLDRLVQMQNALEALERVLADEEKRLPSVYESQGIRSV
ncbi:hypothetical protein FHT87_004605 [Rhizobium sp. BK316]|uniref:hypothetical protein n=1 Tax=Rhizobium sp. BK316 TaxID=2587053 RepID=UPI0016215703|nr:hypothetical protein [Rhizobium sp. BK316]MBB3410673.1 hypothetical protein [Rhizobium sp. BK316]